MSPTLRVASLHVKRRKAAPMSEATTLTLRSGLGVVENVGPSGKTPRQVAIGLADSLAAHGVTHQGARCNIILEGEADFGSGSMLFLGDVILRVTIPCEPCSYGAQMASIRTAHFRAIERYLAVVVCGGIVRPGTTVSSQLNVYPEAPGDFRTRCAWALDQIPLGGVVLAPDFLDAIGASSTYARTLPRWMATARAAGKPTHRVLTANCTAPSWCPDAATLLSAEGTDNPGRALFDLTQVLWF